MSVLSRANETYHDPRADEGEACMRFRLTYEGKLYGPGKEGRASHKHDIRKAFHPQLRRLWHINEMLKNAPAPTLMGRNYLGGWNGPEDTSIPQPRQKRVDWLPGEFACGPYKLLPLVTKDLDLSCGISVLYLRPEAPGAVFRSGDIDGRLKTLFDALRIPSQTSELGGQEPQPDENPFYCLLEDDRLVSSVSVETDTLLKVDSDQFDANDARLIITVEVRRFRPTWLNAAFE